MSDLRGFNANNVEPMDDFDPIPAGKYLAVITDSQTKPNKAGTGSYLELTFQVLDGEYKNRKVWARLNLDNPNDLAVKIARAQLATICKAVGVMTPSDSAQLHNLPLVIHVKVSRNKETDEMANEIKGYSKREQATPANSTSTGARTAVAPWSRK